MENLLSLYLSLTTLRILWLKKKDPIMWNSINMLMSHSKNNKEEESNVTSVIDFIQKSCRLTEFTEEEIRHILGTLDIVYKQYRHILQEFWIQIPI